MTAYISSFVLISILTIVECATKSIVNNTSLNRTAKQLRLNEKLIFPGKTPPPHVTTSAQKSKYEESTREILRKIEEINTQQGYMKRRWAPKVPRINYQIPYNGYSRSQFQNEQQNMELYKYAMSNPILEYLKSQNSQTQIKISNTNPRLRTPFKHNQATDDKNESSNDNNNEENVIEELNQPIRQVTHYQMFALPSPYVNSQMMRNLPQNYQESLLYNQAIRNHPNFEPQNYQHLAAMGNLPNFEVNPSFQHAISNSKYEVNSIRRQPNSNEVNKYDSDKLQPEGRQNWNWPGANFFPIYIRDPFLQMYYAVTNMVEYGPNAGSGGPCKLTPTRGKSGENGGNKIKEFSKNKSTSRMRNAAEIFNNPMSTDYLDVEDILADGQLSFTVKNTEPIRSREASGNEIIVKSKGKPFIYTPKNAKSHAQIISKQNSDTIESPPQTSSDIFLDSVEETELENQKNDINVANEGNRKVFSKDNTGNGIFIHKIKVKQGGVAIAGAGGIASAGEGGTAIVGPNGIAYTTADGTAIAGSGGKVIETQNNPGLIDIIRTAIEQSTTTKNRTTTESSKPKPELVAKPNSKPPRPGNPFFNFNNNG